MILVTTIGKVGAEAARILAARGADVRVFARHPERAAALAEAGVEVVAGDLAEPSTVATALHDVRTVILVSPAVPAEELGVIRLAAESHVEHVVKITSKASSGSPVPRRRDQARIEQGLLASGLGSTLLRNNAYLQNLLMLAPQIAATGAFGSSAGDGRIGMVDARDVAAVAAEIALAPSGHRGRTYWPTGPDAVTYGDVAAILTAVLGRPVRYRSLSVEEQREAMIRAGLPAPLAAMNAQALGLFAKGDSDWVTADVQRITGRAPRDLQSFLVEHATLFDQAAERGT